MIRKMAASSLRFIGEVYSIFVEIVSFLIICTESYFSQVFSYENCEIINNHLFFFIHKKDIGVNLTGKVNG